MTDLDEARRAFKRSELTRWYDGECADRVAEAVIVYRKDLAERVRRLREVESDSPRDAQKRAWNRCLLAVLLLIEPTDEGTP